MRAKEAAGGSLQGKKAQKKFAQKFIQIKNVYFAYTTPCKSQAAAVTFFEWKSKPNLELILVDDLVSALSNQVGGFELSYYVDELLFRKDYY